MIDRRNLPRHHRWIRQELDEVNRNIEQVEDLFKEMARLVFNDGLPISLVYQELGDKARALTKEAKKTPQGEHLYIQVTPTDGGAGRDVLYVDVELDDDELLAVDVHTVTYKVLYMFYGKHATANAMRIRDGFFRDDIKRFMANNHMGITSKIKQVRRVPESVNSIWVNRADFDVEFNLYRRLIGRMESIGALNKNIREGIIIDGTHHT